MNSGPGSRRWLVLSYFSRIDGMACAQHIDDRIPLLREAGIEPVLLTGPCGERWEEGRHAIARCVAPSGIRFEVRHLFRRRGLRGPLHKVLEFLLLLPLLPFYLLEKLVVDLDSQWSWFPLAARRGYALCRELGPELIYSTGGAASAHIAAGRIARRTGIPWVAEFQDPLVHGDWYRGKAARKAFAFAERYVCEHASRVVFLTGEARRRAAARTSLGDRGRCIYPGAEPPPESPPRRRNGALLRFTHLGSFGGSRNPAVLLEAARRLLEDRPEIAGTLRFDFYGHCDASSARRLREFPVPGVVTYHGRVPRREALSAMRDADVLVLIQNIDDFSAETIPSKVYEYLMAGPPILALVHRNPELSAMLESLGHTAVEAADPGSVRAAIETIHGNREKYALRTQTPSPYSIGEAVGRLISIAEPFRMG
ncbi:MAG: glycosyltransferase [Candidatus Deferrimicrobium sp.]